MTQNITGRFSGRHSCLEPRPRSKSSFVPRPYAHGTKVRYCAEGLHSESSDDGAGLGSKINNQGLLTQDHDPDSI